jgi:predicted heme/steroid binding protein
MFDADLKCAYRGRFDASRPGKGQPTGIDLTSALDALINGNQVVLKQYPRMGCNIKWK